MKIDEIKKDISSLLEEQEKLNQQLKVLSIIQKNFESMLADYRHSLSKNFEANTNFHRDETSEQSL